MPELILYHRTDADGWCSAAIALRSCNDCGIDAAVYGINHGDKIPWEEIWAAEKVWMLDFMLPPPEMDRLIQSGKPLIWIDHHLTALTWWQARNEIPLPGSVVLLDPEAGNPSPASRLAACELVWKFCFPLLLAPKAVRLAGRYDVWDHRMAGTREFQAGIRLYEDHIKPTSAWWAKLLESDTMVDALVEDGKPIVLARKMEHARLMQAAWVIEWEGYRWLCVNGPFLNSLAFESAYRSEQHDGCMAIMFWGSKWSVSMYSPDQSKDFTAIAKRHGGGGHPAACGFTQQDFPKDLFLCR